MNRPNTTGEVLWFLVRHPVLSIRKIRYGLLLGDAMRAYNAGKYDEARVHWERIPKGAIGPSPYFETIYRRMLQCYRKLGLTEEAEEMRKAIKESKRAGRCTGDGDGTGAA